MEARGLRVGVKPRVVNPQDLDGTLDTVFTDDLGMKSAEVLNAKGGIVVATYDKDNERTARFFPADFLVAYLTGTAAKPQAATAKAAPSENDKAAADTAKASKPAAKK